MSQLWIAVAGGAAGSALVETLRAARRIVAVPREVARNDARVAGRNRDFELWVANAHLGYLADLRDRAAQASVAGVSRGGTIPQSAAKVKSMWLRGYRDEELSAQRDVVEILAQETWIHRGYRWIHQRPHTTFATSEAARAVLDEWRRPPHHGAGPVEVFDPTRQLLPGAPA